MVDILFVGKESDVYAKSAANYVMQLFPGSTIIFGNREDRLPKKLLSWKGDYIFSYLSPWIIPQSILNSASCASINWHPGPPEYPGIGCTNFAVYNEETIFGITCHHMLKKVDTGSIIEVSRFPILNEDSVYSITQKCYSHILHSFYNIVERIKLGMPLPTSKEKWAKKPYTRKELDALSEIKPDMTEQEANRRIRATTYDRPWAFIKIHGKNYYLTDG